ncbi:MULTISPECIES: TolC family protein [Pandoraea]|uniref:TolC family protein n=1 Tax=Pandoraea TaxID=93217 RepID=UPI001F5CA178|nr:MULTISPECIES: TolC family protein [Pandoraea]
MSGEFQHQCMQARRVIHVKWFFSAAMMLAVSQSAFAFDVFNTESQMSNPRWISGQSTMSYRGCRGDVATEPLELADAVDQALCNSPKTRAVWAQVKAQAAQVGQAKAAFLPTISASWQGVRDDQLTDVADHPTLSSNHRATIQTSSVWMDWVLYDFGARSAALSNTKSLMNAAKYQFDAQLQETFSTVATDYYGAVAADEKFATARESASIAENSLKVAAARVARGVASISDELQARTAYTKARLQETQAEKAKLTSLGVLLSDMNLIPDAGVVLAKEEIGPSSAQRFVESVGDLMTEARLTHPSVEAARAQVDAAEASEAQLRAQGLPKFSLVAKYSRNNQPASLGLGSPQFAATGHDWYVGFQVQIPLFEGFGRVYQVREAHAKAEQKRFEWDEAKRQVGLNVWKAYQDLQGNTVSLRTVDELLDAAQGAFDAATRRYAIGATSIIELLNAQASLADAKQQRVQAIADWNASRLRLAATVGRLDSNVFAELSGNLPRR